MCTNDENSYLIDNKLHLFHVEYHFKDAVTDLVVHEDNTNNTAPNVGGHARLLLMDDTERPIAAVKAKENSLGACPQRNVLGSRPLVHRTTSFWIR